MLKEQFIETAKEVIEKKHPNADAVFIAGSVVRGEATQTSDVDIVIIYENEKLEKAYRESIIYKNTPIEMFVQNTNSLNFFAKQDIKLASPCLCQMISEGITPDKYKNQLANKIKNEMIGYITKGANNLEEDEIKMRRYFITDTLDDLIGCKDNHEKISIISKLYNDLIDFQLRYNNKWSGKGKSLVRALKKNYPELEQEFYYTFNHAFKTFEISGIITLAEKILKQAGGKLWEGYKSYAPKEANKNISE